MNPFAEIEVTPLYSRDGMESQGKSVRIVDEEEKSRWNEIGVVSSNYLLVHNAKVKEVVAAGPDAGFGSIDTTARSNTGGACRSFQTLRRRRGL